ncbi:MAG: hypothetical protein U1E76_04360 [Planctomycetota bacterium]
MSASDDAHVHRLRPGIARQRDRDVARLVLARRQEAPGAIGSRLSSAVISIAPANGCLP